MKYGYNATKTSTTIKVVPHAAMYIVKVANKRSNWLDKSSVYLSAMVGTQFTFSKKFDSKPALAIGGNFGFRYAL
jgi:hypothetical protein